MPIYEYRCTQCQHTFDLYQTVGEAAPDCPRCGAATRKVYASVGLIFKGSGFHTTDYRTADYRKASAGNGDKSDKPASSTESKESTESKDASTSSASSSPSGSSTGSSSGSPTGSTTS